MMRHRLSSLFNGLRQLSSQGFPWETSFHAEPTKMQQVRNASRQMVLAGFTPMQKLILWLWMAISWPVYSTMTSLLDPFAPATDKTLAKILQGIRNSAHPLEFAAAAAPYDTIYSSDLSGLFKLINQRELPDWVHDKRVFAEFCDLHAIPHPRVIDQDEKKEIEEALRLGRLVVKPACGSGGKNVFFASNAHEVQVALLKDPSAVMQQEIGHAQNNCPTHLRIVTGQFKNGHLCLIEILTAASEASNFEIEDSSIVSGSSVSELEQLNFVVEKLLAAHSRAEGIAFLGWDVLLSEGEIFVLETNVRLSLLQIEQASGVPIGHSKVGEILAEYIA